MGLKLKGKYDGSTLNWYLKADEDDLTKIVKWFILKFTAKLYLFKLSIVDVLLVKLKLLSKIYLSIIVSFWSLI